MKSPFQLELELRKTQFQINKELTEELPEIFSDKIWRIVIYEPDETVIRESKVKVGKFDSRHGHINLFFSGWYIPLRKFDPFSMTGKTADLCPIMFLDDYR